MSKPIMLGTCATLALSLIAASTAHAALTAGLAFSAYNLPNRTDQVAMYETIPEGAIENVSTEWRTVTSAEGAYASDAGTDVVQTGPGAVWNRVVGTEQLGVPVDVHLIYRGYMYDPDGQFAFAENIDDNVQIRVNGQVVLKNDQATQGGAWQSVTSNLSNLDATGGTANGNTAYDLLSPDEQMGNFGIGWHAIEILLGEFGGTGGPHGSALTGPGWTPTFGLGIAGIGTSELPTGAGIYDANNYVAFSLENFPNAPDGGPGLRYDDFDPTGGKNFIIPEPASAVMLGGALALGAMRRRRRA